MSTFLLVPATNDFSLLGYQVVARVENRGSAWAKLSPFDSDFVVTNASGGVTSTGSMTGAYPQYVGPGATSYLVAYDVKEGVQPSEFAAVEITPAFETVAAAGGTFEITELQVRYNGSYGLDATGFVTYTGSTDFAEVAVICLDAAGGVLGVAVAQVDGLVAGTPKAFETTGPPTQVQPGACCGRFPEAPKV